MTLLIRCSTNFLFFYLFIFNPYRLNSTDYSLVFEVTHNIGKTPPPSYPPLNAGTNTISQLVCVNWLIITGQLHTTGWKPQNTEDKARILK